MTRLRFWGVLLAVAVPLLVLFSWSRLGSETSSINLERYGIWASGHSALMALHQYHAKNQRLAHPGDVELPPIPKESGVKAWSIQPDAILRVELDAKDSGRPIVLRYVPIVRPNGSMNFDCISATSPARISQICRADVLRSEVDIPAQLAANEQRLQGLQAPVNAAGVPVSAGGSVVAVPADVASLGSCGYQCVKAQSCVTPRPLACGRLVREGSTGRFEITATDDEFRGSHFATLAEADRVCEQAVGPGARVLRSGSVSGFFHKFVGGHEYWLHDEMKAANNCWSSG